MSLQKIQSFTTEKREQLFQKLEQIYLELEENLKAIPRPCTACGACCHFGKSEHRLYVSSLELAFLLDRNPNPQEATEDRCPYQIEGKCSVRHERMVGCRTFYRLHETQDRIAAEELYEKALIEIKQIYSNEGLDWEYRDLMSVF